VQRVLMVVFAVGCFVFPGLNSVAADSPFEVRLIDCSATVPLGIDGVVAVEVRNTSKTRQTIDAFTNFLTLTVVDMPAGFQDSNRAGNQLNMIVPVYSSRIERRLMELPPDWTFQTRFRPNMPFPGLYRFRLAFEYRAGGKGGHTIRAKGKHWKGRVDGSEFSMRVTKPRGKDQAAFWCWRKGNDSGTIQAARDNQVPGIWDLPAPEDIDDSPDLLFTRYLDSTYASYEIYRHFIRQDGFRSADYIWNIASSKGLLMLKGKSWCNAQLKVTASKNDRVFLSGRDYIQCGALWLELVLKNHPDIWFADDVRLMLAGDVYLLGNRVRCHEMLKNLVARGRPYIAMKAGELLRDMQSKNMLPGGPKDLTAAPTAPEGKTARWNGNRLP